MLTGLNYQLAAFQPRRGRGDIVYDLIIRQHPKQSRMCGIGEKADRRPLDPPPIVQLRVYDRESANSETTFLQNPYYFLFASLVYPDSDREFHVLSDGKTRSTTGSMVSSLYHLKDTDNCDAAFFVFNDISVRVEGYYRLKFSLFEIVGHEVFHCKSIYTDEFVVYSAKRFPGMEESTLLSRLLADQGLKIRVRKEGQGRKRLSKRSSLVLYSGAPEQEVAPLATERHLKRARKSRTVRSEEESDEMEETSTLMDSQVHRDVSGINTKMQRGAREAKIQFWEQIPSAQHHLRSSSSSERDLNPPSSIGSFETITEARRASEPWFNASNPMLHARVSTLNKIAASGDSVGGMKSTYNRPRLPASLPNPLPTNPLQYHLQSFPLNSNKITTRRPPPPPLPLRESAHHANMHPTPTHSPTSTSSSSPLCSPLGRMTIAGGSSEQQRSTHLHTTLPPISSLSALPAVGSNLSLAGGMVPPISTPMESLRRSLTVYGSHADTVTAAAGSNGILRELPLPRPLSSTVSSINSGEGQSGGGVNLPPLAWLLNQPPHRSRVEGT
ncbi:uncharacterized protein VTP21DRAFT_3774 [Calcarisporiella thermophila]|uniref:uncharacterized protein n=1 Tax=Calcarisporiella thermophila TaxID=911321 RepID=UPI003742B62A